MTNKAKGWLFLIGAIAAEVTGSLSLKGALDAPALYALVAAGYIGAFVFLSLVLRTGMALGVAYGIWGASGVALTALLSLVIFGCLLYTSPSPRDVEESRMPSSA